MYQLVGYQFQGTFAVAAAVLRIGHISVPRIASAPVMAGSVARVATAMISITCDIYLSDAAFTAGTPALESRTVVFADYPGASTEELAQYTEENPAPASLLPSTLFTDHFSGMVTPPTGMTAPTSENQALAMQAYIALPAHPDMATLLAGATTI
jgi:hypothetical protein